jgi:uncharacterized protein YdeI (YjbR/CyaY-like superfamily)
MDPYDVTHFESPQDFRRWLDVHHEEHDELWVGYWKKATGRPSITWEESVDVALCFGWIDGLRKGIDDEAYAIRFTPRRAGSTWSRRNVERYRAMEDRDLVEAPGRTAYAERKEDRTGIYSFEQEEPHELDEDFRRRLRDDEDAWADWEVRPPGYRRTVIHWVMSAKRQETRERRFRALLEDSAAGRRVKPLRR